jgi:N,N'-diacetyllegionaminate synthase
LPKGHTIAFEDLESKKPSGYGIAAKDYTNVIGRTLAKDKMQWDFLNEDDLQ